MPRTTLFSSLYALLQLYQPGLGLLLNTGVSPPPQFFRGSMQLFFTCRYFTETIQNTMQNQPTELLGEGESPALEPEGLRKQGPPSVVFHMYMQLARQPAHPPATLRHCLTHNTRNIDRSGSWGCRPCPPPRTS